MLFIRLAATEEDSTVNSVFEAQIVLSMQLELKLAPCG